ncbi:MAG: rRNA maturation RNase YbeY [Planctomycetota bacterium]|nr:rRNA maturation RNase YbeY [Planctomycetota bacterium]
MTGGAELLATAICTDSGGLVDPLLENRLSGLLDFAYRRKRKKPASLDVLLADDSEMARLNRLYLGINDTTDVLAFEDGETDAAGRLRLGDMAIGVETARRVAGERGVPFADELSFYALHGLLHLLGRVDEEDDDRQAMLREQLAIMRAYGLEVSDNLL